MVRKALALLVMVTVVGVVWGVVGLLRPNTVDAQAPSAMRSFSGITSVSAGGELSVMITAREYGSPGRVEETLPDGFSYVDGSTVPGPEDIRVTTVVGDDGRTTVRFTLDGDEEFTYKLTASGTPASYTFNGVLKDADRNSHTVGGDSMITVGAGAPMPGSGPSAMRSFSGITSVSAGGELSVMITAREYGSPGRVEETLPDGFSYVDGSTVPGPEDIRVTTVVVDDGRTTVRFTLEGDEEFTYKVTASGTPASYTFNGVLKDADRNSHTVGGDSMITVGAGAPMPGSGPSAMRSFSGITSVSAGGELSVMITARKFGSPGRVEETLPDGFSYVDGSTVPGPEDIRVTTVVGDDGGTTVRFTLEGDEEFTYKVTASGTPASYTFNGVLKDADRNSYAVGGASRITVGPNASRSFSMTMTGLGDEVTVTITAMNYGQIGAVVETLPNGFAYVSSALAYVEEHGMELTFALLDPNNTSFMYTVRAPSSPGSYDFMGRLIDDAQMSHDVGGDMTVMVQPPAVQPPAVQPPAVQPPAVQPRPPQRRGGGGGGRGGGYAPPVAKATPTPIVVPTIIAPTATTTPEPTMPPPTVAPTAMPAPTVGPTPTAAPPLVPTPTAAPPLVPTAAPPAAVEPTAPVAPPAAPEDEGGLPTWAIVLIIIVAVLAVGGGLFAFVRGRR